MARTYDIQNVERIRQQAKGAPFKQKTTGLSMREVVAQVSDELIAMMERGYTVTDIAKWLTGQEMPINASTLGAYLKRARDAKSPRPSRRKRPGTDARPSTPTTGPATSSPDDPDPPHSTA